MALDVAINPSGTGPTQFAGITCSVTKLGNAMGRHRETYPVPLHITPSGLEVKYTDRFDDPRYYSGDTAN